MVRPRLRSSSIVTAPVAAVIKATQTGAQPSRSPKATPVSATCPMPSPIRARRRCTRKIPTLGAASPTSTAAISARCMKSVLQELEAHVSHPSADRPALRRDAARRCGRGG